MKSLFATFLLFFSFQFIFSQEFVEDENWIGDIEGYQSPFLRHYFNSYTKEDVIKAKQKLLLIRQAKVNDEWEGHYQQYGELSQKGLIWNSNLGFIDYYIYTCAIELRGLGFGNVSNLADSVLLNYEKPIYFSTTQKAKAKTQKTLIKVKIGERHFLVPESKLKDFCEYVVGRKAGQNEYDISVGYWWKVEDATKKAIGLPILPKKYAKFVVTPVDAKIIKIGKKTIQRSKNYEGKLENDGYNHFMTLNAGRNQNVRKDMKLYVPELNEIAYIEQVYDTTSIAVIFRRFSDDNKEECSDEYYKIHPCYEIKLGMSAKTQGSF
jgi:hypothetical protein